MFEIKEADLKQRFNNLREARLVDIRILSKVGGSYKVGIPWYLVREVATIVDGKLWVILEKREEGILLRPIQEEDLDWKITRRKEQ